MELSYYLNLANIPQDLIHHQVDYGATYDLISNLNVNTQLLELDIDYIYRNYTIFLTFEKRRFHSQILISNFTNESVGGYAIGINSTNEIFINCINGGFSYIFDIKLGNRNCIAIKRNYNVFSVYKYDVISGAMEESDSIAVDPNTIDSTMNQQISMFGSSSYVSLASNNSSIGYFSGFVDQMVVISEPIEESLIEVIFQGFRPETRTPSVSSSFSSSDRYGWISDGIEQYKQYFDTSFQVMDQYLFTGSLPTGHFVAYEEGVFGSSTEFVINNGYYARSSRLSDSINTGLTPGESVDPGSVATYYSGTIPPGVPNYSYLATTYINKHSGKMSVTREVSLGIGLNSYRFDYNSAYISTSSSTGYSSSFDGSYYSNFKMDGVYSEYSLEYLYSGQSQTPTGYHLLGSYDFTRDSFYVPYNAADSSYYLNGQPEIYGILDGKYIYITGAGSNDYLEYDNTNSYTSLGGVGDNYIGGRFYQRCSRVLASPDYRNLKLNAEYLETSTGHLYHLAKKQNSGTTLLFNL